MSFSIEGRRHGGDAQARACGIMPFVRAVVLLVLAGCQLPPDHVVGAQLDLAAPRDPSSPHDLSSPLDLSPPVSRVLAGYDLTPPNLAGNQLAIDPSAPMARLLLNVTDRDTGLPTPSRVIFRPPPAAGFADNILAGPFNINSPNSATGAVVSQGVLGSPEGVLLVTGLGTVPVPPGSYDLFITRGPEYEAVELHVDLKADEEQRIDAELDRSVDTRGWLAADLHVHTTASFDSKLPLDRRVISMTTNGVELIVTTEHNVSIDLAPIIAELGYGPELLGSIIGDEFNFMPGHGGAYPVTYDPNLPQGGIPTWQNNCVPGVGVNCTPAGDVFDMMHAQYPGVTAVTINHAWWGGADLGYFTNIEWGAGTANPPPALLPTAGKFDAIEVLNGYWTRKDAIAYLTTDWMFLLSLGYRVTALGSSDTHKINWVRAGWPRSWLRLPTDRPGEVTGPLLGEAVRRQRAVASTGPFAELTVDGKAIGDTAIPTSGMVTIEMRVDAPNWMALDKVRLYKDGKLAHEYPVLPGHRPVFHLITKEPVASDSWFVLQADGLQALPGDVVGEYSLANGAEAFPFVITNPVFVDADGDGRWQPPAWAGTPPPFNRSFRRRAPNRDGDGGRRSGPVPEGCSPGETEPPLDAQGAAARYLAPLVNP